LPALRVAGSRPNSLLLKRFRPTANARLLAAYGCQRPPIRIRLSQTTIAPPSPTQPIRRLSHHQAHLQLSPLVIADLERRLSRRRFSRRPLLPLLLPRQQQPQRRLLAIEQEMSSHQMIRRQISDPNITAFLRSEFRVRC